MTEGPSSRDRGQTAVLVLALLILALHASLYGGWMIDDAGITFAYARNLASGHGLVAQPGAQPVEGFSNPLWALVIAVTFALGVFSLAVTPKLLALALISGALTLIFRDLRARGLSTFALAVPLVLLAACPPFVIWTTSGLENALLALLVAGACTNTLAAVEQTAATWRRDLAAGALGALLALTRPDAVLYVGAHAASVAAAEWTRGRGSVLLRTSRRWLTVAAGFLPIFGSYMAFRVIYFGDVVPNTYRAKQKPSPADLLSPGKLFDLVESATGDFAWVVPFFVVGVLVLLLIRRHIRTRLLVLMSYLGVATVSYLVMPPDWMGEFRFATAFFVLLYWTLAELAVEGTTAISLPSGAQRLFKGAAILFAAQAVVIFASRAVAFTTNPPVPLGSIQRFGAEGFGNLASMLSVARPSVLTSDLGGMLLDSRLKVIDLAGLCDRTVASAISISGDPSRLHDYVFRETKPTFMHVVGTFVRLSRFHLDPRFERDYVPLYESWDGPPEWESLWKGTDPVPPFIGDYVRRDALMENPAVLEAMRAAYRRDAMQRSVGPWQLRRDGAPVQRPLLPVAAARVYRQLTVTEKAVTQFQ